MQEPVSPATYKSNMALITDIVQVQVWVGFSFCWENFTIKIGGRKI